MTEPKHDVEGEGRWQVAEGVTLDSLVERLAAVGERTRGVLAGAQDA